jgi:myosin X
VDVSDEAESSEGPFTFSLHARKTTLKLTAKTSEEADEWIGSLQDAIDSCPPIQTVTERLVLEMIKNAHRPDWERIYQAQKILCRISTPIKAPLLALPYGKPPLAPEKEELYSTRHGEAVKIFNSLLSQDSLADPIKQVQEILQKCFDMEDLQSEVFCQLIKQTAGLGKDEVDSPGVLSIWQTLSCMVCSFIPERAIKRYLTMHIKKVMEMFPDTEMAKYAAFCQTSLKRTKRRDFAPSRSEVIACLGRRDMNTVVYSYGSAQCQININSSTTAGEVVQTLTLGLKVSSENNRFALFELCGRKVKVIDDRTILADVLGKFERYYKEDLARMKPGQPMPEKWKLFFKFFCYLKPHSVPSDSIESVFLYEQFCDDVVMGMFPVSQEKLLKLAALRLQYLDGDYSAGSIIEDITEVYPLSRIEQEVREQKDMFGALDLHETYYKDTLRHSKGIGTLTKKTKAPQITEEDKIRAAIEVKKNAIKSSVADLWRRLQGTTANQVQQKYLEILSECAAFGSTFFEAEYTNRDQRFPKDLWLVVNCKGVQIYQRGAMAPIQTYSYENIVSFGAPVPNEYRLIVEGQAPISIHTSQVAEIAKLMKAYIQAVVAQY